MSMALAIPLFAAFVGLVCFGWLAYSVWYAPKTDLRSLMASSGPGRSAAADLRERLDGDETGEEYERIKQLVRKKTKKKSQPTFQERMFRAGIFSEQQKKDFRRLQLMLPFITVVVCAFFGKRMGGWDMVLISSVLGLIMGLYIPLKVLDRKVKRRDEDIMFYLPLVIEQVTIGVSSSLDIGPCLQRIVQLADERDSHNPVTELVRYAQYHVKSGVGLEEALNDVGLLSGHVELKHSFMCLAQVAKFGGEITRQLQELADAVSVQRETKIDAKIKKLELEATGPVALVFLGYMMILLVGFGLQIVVIM